jgi:light-regulated signal transduction histidine kinase (bacteriophytochrome)
LRMVTSFCELLKERYRDRLDGEAVEFIDFAVDGAYRMRQLINDLLDYSRLQTRQVPLTVMSAREAVDSALLNLKQAIGERQALVTVHELPQVLGNGSQLTRLFQNLIGNALKFQKPGERPEVDISAYAAGRHWVFSVSDNGIGLDPKQDELIFGVFQRLHTRDEYPGTGIGLAICKRIVERHGGKIRVESAPGQGATFYFTLKAVDAATQEIEGQTATRREPSNPEEGSGHVRRAG